MATTSDGDITAAAVEAGKLIGGPKLPVGAAASYAVVPVGARIESLEQFNLQPIRARAGVTAHSDATLSAYLNRFKTPASVVFADQQKFVIVGIIDYHMRDTGAAGAVASDGAAWREHRVSYSAPKSLEWQTWRGRDGKSMSQAEFAQFIEENVVDIRSPAGADMLEVSRSLQAKKSVEFSSALRLADGDQQFSYAETISGSTSQGRISVPAEFTLGIPVFFGGQPYAVTARLRYRINEGKLALWYQLYRPEHVEQDAFGLIAAAVAEATGIAVWDGVP